MKNRTLGEKLSPILAELEGAIWESEFIAPGVRPQYTQEGLRGAIKIFSSALLDAMWDKHEKDGDKQVDRERMALLAGTAIHKLVKNLTNLDTKKLYGR